MSAHSSTRVTVIRASAHDLLAGFPDHSIDVLITDPPYTTVERCSASGHLRDWFRGGMSWTEIGRILALAHRKLKPTGLVFVMTNAAGLREAITALQRAGFQDVRPITWNKRAPGVGGGLRHQTEFVLLGRLPGSRSVTGVDLVSVSAVGPGTADRYPTQKPADLGRKLVAIAGIRRGDVVVDPFAGSGALLVGAKERGATVIAGDIATRAIRNATEGLVARPAQAASALRAPRGTSLEGPRRGRRGPIRNSARTRRPPTQGQRRG